MKIIKKIVFYIPFVIIFILLSIKLLNLKLPFKLEFNDMKKQNIQKSQTYAKFDSFSLKKDSIVPNNQDWYYLDPTQFNIILNNQDFNDFKIEKDFYKSKLLYETHCQYCHDSAGKGNGWIVTNVILDSLEEGFPQPQNLTRKITKNFSKQRLFHILSSGQNLMFSISHKLNLEERKLIMNYIQFLQNKY